MMFTVDPADERVEFLQQTVAESGRAYLSDLGAGGKERLLSESA